MTESSHGTAEADAEGTSNVKQGRIMSMSPLSKPLIIIICLVNIEKSFCRYQNISLISESHSVPIKTFSHS